MTKIFIITEESKEAAKREYIGALNNLYCASSAFSLALDALCVKAGEGWCVFPENRYGNLEYRKGKWGLVRVGKEDWKLYDLLLDCAIETLKPYTVSPEEAQAWADAEIAKHEAKQQSKPFGPGTRLRAANGDELVIISFDNNNPWVAALNLTSSLVLIPANDNTHFMGREKLHQALLASGATIIED